MNQELQGVKNELLAAIQELRAEQKDSATKLLTAFLHWQENSDIKFQRLRADTSNATRAGELRLDNFEARLQELEKRFLMGEGESP